MQNYEKIILSYFGKEPGSRIKLKQLAKTLNIGAEDYPEFRDTVKALTLKGKLYRYKGNCYGLSDMKGEISGTVDMHPRGFAFVHTPDAQKIFIPEEGLANAAHGDTVAVVLHRKQRPSRDPEGHIKRIISRGRNEFICTFQTLRGYALGIPASHHLRSEIVIDDMNGISPQDGEYIIVEITHWQPGRERHRGRIKRLVGKDSVPEFDAVMVATKHSIPDTFSPETLKQVENAQYAEPDDPGRKDLRALSCFTIDPEDARDFDDAVSIEMTQEGHYRLGVHIADVSHY
ncbi:MAG: RNB domain-containing ribonuclease, partial [FCB group bacterium]|nr:RNB domain-containing ribonuclease [FCB group bacterium]